jgi:hypothetical protein
VLESVKTLSTNKIRLLVDNINVKTNKYNNMISNCCGAEPSYLSDERCGDCLEWAEFDNEE